MRILILTYSFEPDLGPCALRSRAILDGVMRRYPDAEVEVFSTTPNRYSFTPQAKVELTDKLSRNIRIHRVCIAQKSGTIFEQVKLYCLFFLKALLYCRKRKYDVVISTSSKIMTGFLGVLIGKYCCNSRVIIDIRDLFSDSLSIIISKRVAKVIIPFILALERWTFTKSDHINFISPGFNDYVVREFGQLPSVSNFTNGVDNHLFRDRFLDGSKFEWPRHSAMKIVYAGNFGYAQNLFRFISGLLSVAFTHEFIFIGDGSEKMRIERLIKNSQCQIVKLREPISREEIIQIYADADVLFFHLANQECLTRVIPSKLFEYAATGKPIVAGVSGWCREFCEEIPGVFTFNSGNIESFLGALESCFSGPACYSRETFLLRFDRARQIDQFLDEAI